MINAFMMFFETYAVFTKVEVLQIRVKSIMVHSTFLTLTETHGLIPFHYDFSSFLGGYLIRTEVMLPDEGIGQAD